MVIAPMLDAPWSSEPRSPSATPVPAALVALSRAGPPRPWLRSVVNSQRPARLPLAPAFPRYALRDSRGERLPTGQSRQRISLAGMGIAGSAGAQAGTSVVAR